MTRTREKRLYYETLNQKKTPPTLKERWPRCIKEQERDHTNHSHNDTKMPTRSGLSFDPAAFCQAPFDPEPAEYVSPLYYPSFEMIPLEDRTFPGYYADVVFLPAVQDDLRKRIATYLNDPPYQPADTEPYPDPIDPSFEHFFAASLYRHDPDFAAKVEAAAKIATADDLSLSSVDMAQFDSHSPSEFDPECSMTESTTDWRTSCADHFVGNDLWTSEIEEIACNKVMDYLAECV
jgi:hypothetical protein